MKNYVITFISGSLEDNMPTKLCFPSVGRSSQLNSNPMFGWRESRGEERKRWPNILKISTFYEPSCYSPLPPPPSVPNTP